MDHPSVSLSYDLLKEITNDFSEERKIGSGSYGRVYKGVHKDGKTIAVKLLHDMPALDDEQFKREFNNLMCLEHDNIVRLVGYCDETRKECAEYKGDFIAVLEAISGKRHINIVELKGWCYGRSIRNSIDFMGCFSQQKGKLCIVYELVPNGNLEDHLHYREQILPWENRYQIVKGIGRALHYLHHECYVPILHKNIMPSNVLLDHDFNAKLAGFRLSIIASQNNAAVVTTSMGKNSYMDPQFMKHGEVELNCKTDVYSFGIVLLEIACTGKSREEVRELYRHSAAEPEVMEDAADPKLGGDFDRMEMERAIVLGALTETVNNVLPW